MKTYEELVNDENAQIKIRIAEAKRKVALKRSQQLQEEKKELSADRKVDCGKDKTIVQSTGAVPKIQKPEPVDPSELRIFVRNLRRETTEASLKQYFSRWGHVADVFIRKSNNSYNGTPCSMGFITFSSFYKESPLSVSIHVIDGMSVHINKVQVQPNYKHENVEKSRTLMISGPIHDIVDKDLTAHFSRFGTVFKVKRKRDPNNPKKFQRFAFICFKETSAVDKAMQNVNHLIKGQIVDARRVKDEN